MAHSLGGKLPWALTPACPVRNARPHLLFAWPTVQGGVHSDNLVTWSNVSTQRRLALRADSTSSGVLGCGPKSPCTVSTGALLNYPLGIWVAWGTYTNTMLMVLAVLWVTKSSISNPRVSCFCRYAWNCRRQNCQLVSRVKFKILTISPKNHQQSISQFTTD